MDRLTTEAAAAYLGLSVGAVYDLVYAGKVEFYRLGAGKGSLRIDRAELDRYLAASRIEVIPPTDDSTPTGQGHTIGQSFPNLRRFGYRR